jgi:hypothetical protein
MPVPLIASDATLKVSFGTDAQLGASPTPAAPSTAYECQAKSVRATVQSSTIDISTLCSTTVATLGTRKTGSLEMEVYIDKTNGPVFQPKVGYLAKVELDLDGAGAVGGNKITYNGLVTDVAIGTTPGEVSTENVTIALGAFGFTTVTS